VAATARPASSAAAAAGVSVAALLVQGDDTAFGSLEWWAYAGISCFLVLFAGIMSGLTLGLMSLGLVELEILQRSGTDSEKAQAGTIRTPNLSSSSPSPCCARSICGVGSDVCEAPFYVTLGIGSTITESSAVIFSFAALKIGRTAAVWLRTRSSQ
jgi:hypothetical protein